MIFSTLQIFIFFDQFNLRVPLSQLKFWLFLRFGYFDRLDLALWWFPDFMHMRGFWCTFIFLFTFLVRSWLLFLQLFSRSLLPDLWHAFLDRFSCLCLLTSRSFLSRNWFTFFLRSTVISHFWIWILSFWRRTSLFRLRFASCLRSRSGFSSLLWLVLLRWIQLFPGRNDRPRSSILWTGIAFKSFRQTPLPFDKLSRENFFGYFSCNGLLATLLSRWWSGFFFWGFLFVRIALFFVELRH